MVGKAAAACFLGGPFSSLSVSMTRPAHLLELAPSALFEEWALALDLIAHP
jgi:hypothetical protein